MSALTTPWNALKASFTLTVFSWLSPFDLLFEIYLGAPTHQRRSACPSLCVALFTAIRAAALPQAFFPVVPSVAAGEGFRRRR
jgi:hypothetical protein